MNSTNLLLISLLFLHILLLAENGMSLEISMDLDNTNIISFQNQFRDLNRLRLETYASVDTVAQLSATLTVDNISDYDRATGDFDNDLELYRLYTTLQTDAGNVILGKQRIPFGVGRIWNPIDVFNPVNIVSAEPEEREGTTSLRVELFPSSLSAIDVTIAEDKYAARIKGYLKSFDIALVGVIDDEDDLRLIGWEIEGELLETGLELRSEGGMFYDSTLDEYYSELIVGMEYGFTFPLTLLVECNIDTLDNTESGAFRLTSQLSSLLQASILVIYSFDESSTIYGPLLDYSLSDEMSLSLGAFINGGVSTDIAAAQDVIYLNWFVQF